MTAENARDLKKYYQERARQALYQYYTTGKEEYNDEYALCLETADIIELGICQLHLNEERRRGLSTDERRF